MRASFTISDANVDLDAAVWPVLIAWGQGHQPSVDQFDQLLTWTFNRQELAVWQLPVESVRSVITARAELMQTFCARLDSGQINLPVSGHWSDWIVLLWTLWLPLAKSIDRKQRAHQSDDRSDDRSVFVQGILGAQGTGKTTLTQILSLILDCLDQRVVALSIDDLYLSYAERRELMLKDPRLVWRGPPGTHDVHLGVQTLTALKHCKADQSVAVPQFDKSLYGGQGDRIAPRLVRSPSVVLFEGWFMGTQPLTTDIIHHPDFRFPTPIVSAEDRQFALDCNQRLAAYLPLWALIDDLIVLQPQDYRFSLQWRQEAERRMMAQSQEYQSPSPAFDSQAQSKNSEEACAENSQKGGMSDEQIAEFVCYFWKALHPNLFIAPLTMSVDTSLVVNIERDHQLSRLCLP